jgi:hypothetical protein
LSRDFICKSTIEFVSFNRKGSEEVYDESKVVLSLYRFSLFYPNKFTGSIKIEGMILKEDLSDNLLSIKGR